MTPAPTQSALLRDGLGRCRPIFLYAAAFSALVNILYLTPTIFMLQVYDRVVPAASGPTLLAVSLIGLVGLATLALLDWLRGRLLVRASARFESQLAGPLLQATLATPGLNRLARAEAVRDFDVLRQTLAGGAMFALFDLPWAPVYLLAAFLLHPLLALVTLVATAILVALAWANERATHAPLDRAGEAAAAAYAVHGQISAYAEEVRAIGMVEPLCARSLRERADVVGLQQQASFIAGGYGAIIKFVRLVFQSLALAVGAWLAIDGRISPGAIIAASLLLGRTLAPIELVVGSWKTVLKARVAYRRIDAVLAARPERRATTLPMPAGALAIEGATVLAPASTRELLSGVTLRVAPGEAIGLVGLSGAGKSTLLRLMAGAVQPRDGSVRFDGAARDDWDPDRLARGIGYLPQDFELFPGTVADNISRFDRWRGVAAAEIDAGVLAAAGAIGAHDTILRLPRGYDTPVGNGGVGLSAGQKQRISLARAFYGAPRLMLLDEPNAHLDADASAALFAAIARCRREQVTVVFAAHSADLLDCCDRIVVVAGGRIAEHSAAALRAAPTVKLASA